jgi:potassium-transporting ATPase potassium-binding subunit
MNIYDFIQIFITLLILIIFAQILGAFIHSAVEESHEHPRWLQKTEKMIFKTLSIDSLQKMNWRTYAKSILLFNLIGFIIVFIIQILQKNLPLNPQNLDNVSWHSAFNTAISFMTNTNWQGYSGEATLSYFTQMVGLTVQNFVSAGTGMAVAIALCRALTNKQENHIGNFWQDLYRTTVYVLFPMSFILSILLVSEGVVQNFNSYNLASGIEGVSQIIPQGPAASQIAIKQLGTNGGGFFGVNSAHPFENPTPFSNWLQLISILLIPAAMVFTFGEYTKDKKQAWSIFASMFSLLVIGLCLSLISENNLPDGDLLKNSLEGKELRFGNTNSVLWSVFTSAASNGSVNAMHSSLSPLSGGVALFNIMLGEIIFGGVGAGLYGMFLFVLLTVFLSGLMVGRTPEYLGKKIEAREIQMVILGIILPSAVILIGAGLSSVLPIALSSLSHTGPHGLSEILYAFSSAGGNNGSAFAGLSVNTVYYNVMLGFVMLIGRFGVILPVLAIAGSLAAKSISPPSPGTFSTDSTLFVCLLIGVIIIVGGLTFLPALALGPIVEHFLLFNGTNF